MISTERGLIAKKLKEIEDKTSYFLSYLFQLILVLVIIGTLYVFIFVVSKSIVKYEEPKELIRINDATMSHYQASFCYLLVIIVRIDFFEGLNLSLEP